MTSYLNDENVILTSKPTNPKRKHGAWRKNHIGLLRQALRSRLGFVSMSFLKHASLVTKQYENVTKYEDRVLDMNGDTNINIPPEAVTEERTRSSGPGGQNVNKVETSVALRVDTTKLALSDDVLARLSRFAGRKLLADGTLILKSQVFRTQGRNRAHAWQQLHELLAQASIQPKTRRATKPSRASQAKRLAEKKRRSDVKSLRRQTDS